MMQMTAKRSIPIFAATILKPAKASMCVDNLRPTNEVDPRSPPLAGRGLPPTKPKGPPATLG
jgi:hypothetical protein